MKRIIFSRFNNNLGLFENLGHNSFPDDTEDDYLYKVAEAQAAEVGKALGFNVQYHIEVQSKDGSWNVLAKLQKTAL